MAKAIKTKMVLVGEKELKRLLRELPRRAVKTALKKAVTAGAQPVVKATRAGARGLKVSGLMAKAVSKKIKSYSDGNAIAIVGASRAVTGEYQGRNRVPANYWHLVLGGTRPHVTRDGRLHPGAKPQNILADAVKSTAGQVRTAMEAKMKQAIEREAAKLAGK